MDNTPDVSKLCPECGYALDVKKHPEQHAGEAPLYALRCPECRWERLDTEQPMRELTPGEVLLLARIAVLEDTQRQRVTADEPPMADSRILAPYRVAGSRAQEYIMEFRIDKDGRWFTGNGYQHGGAEFWWPLQPVKGAK